MGALAVSSVTNLKPHHTGSIYLYNPDGSISVELRAGGVGLDNFFIGTKTGQSNTVGHDNIAIGANNFWDNTEGSWNVSLGNFAMRNNTLSEYCVAIGYRALTSLTDGDYNIAIGASALRDLKTGQANTAVGVGALRYTDGGYSNTAYGVSAGYANTTGYYNCFFGEYSGYKVAGSSANATTTAHHQTLLGFQAGQGSPTQRNYLTVVGADAQGDASNAVILGRVVEDCVGIGTMAPTGKLHVGTGAASNIGIVVKATTSQSANLQEWQDVNGASLLAVSPTGEIVSSVVRAANTVLAGPTSGASATATFRTLVAADIPALSYAPVSHAHAGTDITSGTIGTAYTDYSPAVIIAPGSSTRNIIQPTNAAYIPLIVRGAASQSANLQEWQDSTNAIKASVNATGQLFGTYLTITPPTADVTDMSGLILNLTDHYGLHQFYIKKYYSAYQLVSTSGLQLYSTSGAISVKTDGQGQDFSIILKNGVPASYTALTLTGISGKLGIGFPAPTPATTIHGDYRDTMTNAVTDVLTASHSLTTANAGANGIGAGLVFQAATSASAIGASTPCASISGLWTTATDASRASALVFSTVSAAGALTERMRIEANAVTYPNVNTFTFAQSGTVSISRYYSRLSISPTTIGGTTSAIPVLVNINDIASGATPVLVKLLPMNTGISLGNNSGSSILFACHTNTPRTERDQAAITSLWTNAADTTFASALVFKTCTAAGAVTEHLRIDGIGEVNIGSTNGFYWGDTATDGTWRIIRATNDLSFSRRESGNYVSKAKILASGAAQFGGATDYSAFETDGTLVFNGAATVWDDSVVSGITVKTGTNAPAWKLLTGGLYAYAFQPSAQDDQVFFTLQLPHGYKEGTAIKMHVHLVAPTNPGADAVTKWALEYVVAAVDGSYSGTTVYGTMTINTTDALKNKLLSFTDISGSGLGISSVLICRLYRYVTGDTVDTYTDDVFLVSADAHIEMDTVGSRTPTAK